MKKVIFLLFLMAFRVVAQKTAPPAPYGAVPSPQQVEWQKMEYYMFIHFGPNTFTNKEWGHGDEDPKVFNPTNLDARQWARTAKAAGMKAIIITAKHHDGFCLWPSKFSTHTVRESAWKNGKGDVLRELSDACREYGLKFGVYLSPWDRNHPAYGTPAYNQVFANTLDEVLSSYGDVFEQWFDGANGEGANGKKQVYDWNLFRGVVFKHQPKAIIFSDIGPGCRWMGNESGIAGETNWSTLNTDGFGMGSEAPPTHVLNTGNENGKYWIPAEVDVSIRPGWFYSPETDDRVKTLTHLMKIYYSSVGRNGNLLLNVPVSTKGLIHPNDSARLMEFRKTVAESFRTNLALGKTATASVTRGNDRRFSAVNLLDGNFDTYWTTDDAVRTGSFVVDLGKPTEINRIVLQEYIPLGQRVKSFKAEAWNGKTFVTIDQQTTIGYKRILVFPTLKTDKVRVTILDANACPVLAECGIYKAPELLSNPEIARSKQGMVTITSDVADPVIRYTTNGSEPTLASARYTTPFPFAQGGTIKARAFINNGADASETILASFDLAPEKWSVVNSDENAKRSASRAIDSNPGTVWQSSRKEGSTGLPQELVIDLGKTLNLKGFTYTPRQDGRTEGTIYQYSVYVSENGTDWKPVLEKQSFANIKNNPVKQTVPFASPQQARFIKLVALSSVNENEQFASAAEVGVIVN
ncbi:alpha-L-fucosidase [Larkinella sp. VNQ87]|uniref:alpha-L-fucosidase n=1 Tax=Larkinella sp. VNQ87 TaxID=3400921 RepID=UPI003C02563E